VKTFLIALALLLPFGAASAQGYNWCGYSLLAGLEPLAEQDLTLISYLTPPESDLVNPYQLFQTRWNLAGTAVIIEGCFIQQPTRGLVVQLLAAAMFDLSNAEINAELEYTVFENVDAVRAYLSANLTAWEQGE
jgi:hypothetical protein